MNGRSEKKVEILISELDEEYTKSLKLMLSQNNIEARNIENNFSETFENKEASYFPAILINLSILSDLTQPLRLIRSNSPSTIIISYYEKHDYDSADVTITEDLVDYELGNRNELLVRDIANRVKAILDIKRVSSYGVNITYPKNIDHILFKDQLPKSGVLKKRQSAFKDIFLSELNIVLQGLFSSDVDTRPVANEIAVEQFGSFGKSNSYVFTIRPKIILDDEFRKSAVLKFGPKEEIVQEARNYNLYVEWFLTVEQAVRKIGFESANRYAGVLYSYPRDNNKEYFSLAEFFRKNETKKCKSILRKMFNKNNKHYQMTTRSIGRHWK